LGWAVSWIIYRSAQMLEAHQGTKGTTSTCACWAALLQGTKGTPPYRGVPVVLLMRCACCSPWLG
jgi:hypothetical protein